MNSVVTSAAPYQPAPHAIPTAATTHSVAAVVRPRIDSPSRMIAPAPRKPMPVTICAAMRVGSVRTTAAPLATNSWKPYAEMTVKSAEPSETSRCVRMPASRSRSSRSTPIAPPRSAAAPSRKSTWKSLSVGTALAARSCNRLVLMLLQVRDSRGCEIEQVVEAGAVERDALGRRLHLDEAAVTGHDDIDVDVGVRVFRVVEIEQRLVVDDADRNGGDRSGERLREPEVVERAARRDVRARDRGAARAAVGLQDVAVEVNGSFAERLEVDDAAESTADQPLDLDRAAALLPTRRLAVGAVARRRRQQRVLRRHPAAARAREPPRHAVLHRRGAQHPRLPLRPEHDPVRLLEERRVGDARPQLVRPATVGAAHATASSAAISTCSTSPSGSCRKRAPSARKRSGSPVVRNR